eukprot:SAG25_NODE_650_length_6188_cov_4.455740_10_plen_81_part_00
MSGARARRKGERGADQVHQVGVEPAVDEHAHELLVDDRDLLVDLDRALVAHPDGGERLPAAPEEPAEIRDHSRHAHRTKV